MENCGRFVKENFIDDKIMDHVCTSFLNFLPKRHQIRSKKLQRFFGLTDIYQSINLDAINSTCRTGGT